ncbi:MAG: hypothetical protein AB8B63_24965 [Granulosicoccus sp.]
MNFKYLSRLGGIAFCLALLLCILVRLFVPPDIYTTRLFEFSRIAHDIEVITLGNSHGRSFHFESMNLNGYHFFEQAGDLEEMERRANVVIDRLPALRYVLLPLSPGALSISQRVVAEDYEDRRLLVRKGTPLTFDVRNYSLEELIGTITYRLFRIDALQRFVYKQLGYKDETRTTDAMKVGQCFETGVYQDSSDLQYEVPEEGIIDGYRRLVMKYECLPKYGNQSSRNRQRHIRLTLEKYPDIVSENIERLLRLANKLESRGVELLLVNTPNTPWHYNTDETNELKPRFENATSEISKHSNIRYFDFHNLYFDELENDENNYFFDDNHLALIGAKRFSADFAKELNHPKDNER